jgi:hypothetical protein
MTRFRFVVLLLGITGALAVVAALIHRGVDPAARTDVAALVLSAASLAVAALTFYLLELRGADITIRQQHDTGSQYSKQRSVWQGNGSFSAVIECRLLIANEGRRPGVLETLTLGKPSFSPHHARMLRANLHKTHTENGNELRLPTMVRDGDLVSAVVPIELSPGAIKADFVQQCAYDLRELDSINVPFQYSYSSHGVVYRKSGSATAPLVDFCLHAREVWKEQPAAQGGYRILAEGTPA